MVDRDGDCTTRKKLEGLVTVVTGKERESTRTANHMVLKMSTTIWEEAQV